MEFDNLGFNPEPATTNPRTDFLTVSLKGPIYNNSLLNLMSRLSAFIRINNIAAFLIALCFFLSSNSYGFDKRKGSTVMVDNGKTLSKFGKGLKDSDGTLYLRYGNAIKDSNGEIWQLYGSKSIRRRSDGKTCTVLGNSIKCD